MLTIAEISIGIAGFSGVIAAFLQRGGLHPADRARFVVLFATAFTTLVLAYVPITLSHSLGWTAQTWIYSSAVMVLVWFVSVILGLLFMVPEVRTETENRSRYPFCSSAFRRF